MHIDRDDLIERLDEMVEAGRLTEEQAERLRTAHQPGEFDDVVREIRLEHIRARVDAALEDGRLTQEEADAMLAGFVKLFA